MISKRLRAWHRRFGFGTISMQRRFGVLAKGSRERLHLSVTEGHHLVLTATVMGGLAFRPFSEWKGLEAFSVAQWRVS